MDSEQYREMRENFQAAAEVCSLRDRKIYLFGHCGATEELADLILNQGYGIEAILDNSCTKQGRQYRGIVIREPSAVLEHDSRKSVVFLVTRFYEAMYAQLRKLGFAGKVQKLVEYDTGAEYSLSPETVKRKNDRVAGGMKTVRELEEKYPGMFRIYCPFPALGDVCFCMSYLPYFQKRRGFSEYVICVSRESCAQGAVLFGAVHVEVLRQECLDAAVQAELYMQDEHAFIAHQDRPYAIDLCRALHVKKITLEKMYCCGVFGLPGETKPVPPAAWLPYRGPERIEAHHAVIFAPYAKSVPLLPKHVWEDIVADYGARGCQLFTNVAEGEEPLKGTEPICPGIREMKSVVERAGTFIGIRSGLCDVIRTADCHKIALYPDYHYCGTRWTAAEIYAIEGFENIVVNGDFQWLRR